LLKNVNSNQNRNYDGFRIEIVSRIITWSRCNAGNCWAATKPFKFLELWIRRLERRREW
jgi:hypothetical protein